MTVLVYFESPYNRVEATPRVKKKTVEFVQPPLVCGAAANPGRAWELRLCMELLRLDVCHSLFCFRVVLL